MELGGPEVFACSGIRAPQTTSRARRVAMLRGAGTSDTSTRGAALEARPRVALPDPRTPGPRAACSLLPPRTGLTGRARARAGGAHAGGVASAAGFVIEFGVGVGTGAGGGGVGEVPSEAMLFFFFFAEAEATTLSL